ncbi:MAG TPA: hypothetical protein VF790_01160 [Dissulfurispiraceae bacterium]
MSKYGVIITAVAMFLLASVSLGYAEGDPAGKVKKEEVSSGLTVTNKSPLPVIGIYLQTAVEAGRLATIGRPNVGNNVYSEEIKPGASATVNGIEPDDYVITIVKSNGRGDIIRQELKPGKVFTYTIE